VVDGSAPVTEEDMPFLLTAAKQKRWILVWSKKDMTPDDAFLDFPMPLSMEYHSPSAVVQISSVTGEGLDALETAVKDLFPTGDPVEAGSLLTDARQEEAVARARDAIRRAAEALELGLTPDAVLTDAEEALDALGELTGRTAKEEIVSRIFERFCVGK
jgi:tRNA modification GTPase